MGSEMCIRDRHWVKGEAMAVNEAEHTTGIVWKVRREERLRRRENVVGWCCHTHTGNEVSSCVGKASKSVCILALWMQCGFSGFVGFWWTSGGQSTLG